MEFVYVILFAVFAIGVVAFAYYLCQPAKCQTANKKKCCGGKCKRTPSPEWVQNDYNAPSEDGGLKVVAVVYDPVEGMPELTFGAFSPPPPLKSDEEPVYQSEPIPVEVSGFEAPAAEFDSSNFTSVDSSPDPTPSYDTSSSCDSSSCDSGGDCGGGSDF